MNQYTMMQLENILKENDYIKIKFKLSKTQHLFIKAQINGVEGNFILDTGASNSCVDSSYEEFFKLKSEYSKNKVAGAGSIDMESRVSELNIVQLGKWKAYQMTIVLFDLFHINTALNNAKSKSIHGIIGADVLLEGKAIIDYSNQILYLKKQSPLKRNLSLF